MRGTIVDGVAELRLEDLSPGTKTMLVLYAGNEVVEQAPRLRARGRQAEEVGAVEHPRECGWVAVLN